MVKLVSVATHSDGYLPWLQKSCDRHNVKLNILGWNQKWQGFVWRFSLMIDYLKSVDPNELVCFIDAYDVILLRSLDDIEEYYNNIVKLTGKKIIIASENAHNPYIKQMSEFIFDKCKNIQINAGTYMGRAKDILEVLTDMNSKNKPSDDDQVVYTDYCNNHPDIFYIDHDKIFFLTVEDTFNDVMQNFDIKIENNGSKYPIVKYMESRPFFIHGNGNTLLNSVIEKLGYTITEDENKKINGSHTKIIINKVKYYVKHLLNIYWYHIIIICILLFIIYRKYYRTYNLI